MKRPSRRAGVLLVLAGVYLSVTWFYPFVVFNPLWLAVKAEGYAAAVRNGRAELGPAREFEELFPQARHGISYYTGEMGPPTWGSEVGLFGRYVLSLRVKITFDWTRRHIRSRGEPQFQLVEVTRVTEGTGGQHIIDYEAAKRRTSGSSGKRNGRSSTARGATGRSSAFG
jgi:hypothetical protein